MDNKCKNKKCQRILPEGYKYKYCENCRNNKAHVAKKVVKGAGGVLLMVGGVAVTVVTKGKINPNKKA